MGSLFSTPKPRPVRLLPAPEPEPEPVAADNSAEDPAAQRLAQIQRRRRGLAGTVLTGWRGVLAPRADRPGRKNLLGE